MSKSGVHLAIIPLDSGLARALTQDQTANPRDEPPGLRCPGRGAGVLQISPTTVIHELKKGLALTSVNTPLLETLRPDDVGVRINRLEAAEVDEMWSFVDKRRSRVGYGTPLITGLEES